MEITATSRLQNRRIVTGLDHRGLSTIIFDGPAPLQVPSPHPGSIYAEIWETDCAPADNRGNAGSRIFLVRYQGRQELADRGVADKGPGMHTSHAVEYIIILEGRPTLYVETGSMPLEPGDFVVFRGGSHDIHNHEESEVLLAAIMIDALPLEASHGCR